MLLIFRKIPVGFGWRWKDVLSQCNWFVRCLLVLIWLSDKIGLLLEYTPLYFASSGFWIDYYIPRGQKVIQGYREGRYSQGECELLLKRIDRRLYGFWLLSITPILFGVMFILLPYIWAIPNITIRSVSIVVLPLVLHEFACSSSLRRWRAAEETGDEELAKIINKAGPSCKNYFREVVLNNQNRKEEAWQKKVS